MSFRIDQELDLGISGSYGDVNLNNINDNNYNGSKYEKVVEPDYSNPVIDYNSFMNNAIAGAKQNVTSNGTVSNTASDNTTNSAIPIVDYNKVVNEVIDVGNQATSNTVANINATKSVPIVDYNKVINEVIDAGQKITADTNAMLNNYSHYEIPDMATIITNGWATSSYMGVIPVSPTALKETGATVANGALSLFKGVVDLVESIGDFALLVGGGVGTLGTAIDDIYMGIATNDWSWSYTKLLWNDTLVPAVSYNWSNALDEELGWRQSLDEWSLIKSDGTACQVLEGVGYIGGIIALTVATAGAGSAVLTVGGTGGTGLVTAGAAAANVSGAVATVSSSALVSGGIAAAAGIGKNTAASWNDGASVVNGLCYGTAKGLYEGAEMALGYTINSVKVLQGAGVGSQIGNSLIHVGLDTIDGGSRAIIDPILSMIYNPNDKNTAQIMQFVNYDKDGNKINDLKWEDLTFGQKYDAIFNYNGGWKTVGVQAASAAAMSFISEIPDISASIRASNVVKEVTTVGMSDDLIDRIQSLKGNSFKNFIAQADQEGILDTVGSGLTLKQLRDACSLIDETSSFKLFDGVLRENNSIRMLNTLSSLNDSQFNYIITNIDDISSNNSISKFFKNVVDVYKQGEFEATEAGHYHNFFKNFREHGIGHSTAVAAYANKIASMVDGVNIDETVYAAFIHDFGMKGGYTKLDGDIISDILKLNEATKINTEIVDDKTVITSIVVNGREYKNGTYIPIESMRELKFDAPDYLDALTRKNHPLNSAIAVLTESNVLPENVDKDVVALLAMTHSKSTSGIKYFSSKEQWLGAIDKLEESIKQYNIDNGTSYSVDFQRLRNMITEDDIVFKRLMDEALAIRDADAMSDVVFRNGGTLMQDGNIAITTTRETRGNNFNLKVLSPDEEYALIDDVIYDSNGNFIRRLGDSETFSKKIHIGEGNVKFDSSYIDGNYYAKVELVNPNQTPNATFDAIVERIMEVNTYSNADSRVFEIVLPKEAKGTVLGQWYEEALEGVKNNSNPKKGLFKGVEVDFDMKKIGEDVVERQHDFYNNLRIVYR